LNNRPTCTATDTAAAQDWLDNFNGVACPPGKRLHLSARHMLDRCTAQIEQHGGRNIVICFCAAMLE
jgi:hypothetical protein